MAWIALTPIAALGLVLSELFRFYSLSASASEKVDSAEDGIVADFDDEKAKDETEIENIEQGDDVAISILEASR
jgi:hypothetical protein